jgi:hypothetical protein
MACTADPNADTRRHVLLIRVWGGEFAALTAQDKYGIDRLRDEALYGAPPAPPEGEDGTPDATDSSADDFEWDCEVYSFPDNAALRRALDLMDAALYHTQTYDGSKSCENYTYLLSEVEYATYHKKH